VRNTGSRWRDTFDGSRFGAGAPVTPPAVEDADRARAVCQVFA
jgi:hypothetical protein